MKRVLCFVFVIMLISPCAFANELDDIDISSLFGETPLEEHTDAELQTMLLLVKLIESYIQTEIDSRANTKATVAPLRVKSPTATPEPEKNNSPLVHDGFSIYGDAGIKYKSAYLKKSGGKTKLVVVFDWVNNGDSTTSFGAKFDFDAYQNGIQLSVGIISGFDTQFTTKIRPGKTLEGYYIWELKDTKSPVTVVFDKSWDWVDNYPDTEIEIDISKLKTK